MCHKWLVSDSTSEGKVPNKITLISDISQKFRGSQAICTSDQPATNMGVLPTPFRLDISLEHTQNSGKHYTYNYSFITKDTVRISQMKRHRGQNLGGYCMHAPRNQGTHPLGTSIFSPTWTLSLSVQSFYCGFITLPWLTEYWPWDWTQISSPSPLPRGQEIRLASMA